MPLHCQEVDSTCRLGYIHPWHSMTWWEACKLSSQETLLLSRNGALVFRVVQSSNVVIMSLKVFRVISGVCRLGVVDRYQDTGKMENDYIFLGGNIDHLWGLCGPNHGNPVSGQQSLGMSICSVKIPGDPATDPFWGGECPADLRSLYLGQLAVWRGSQDIQDTVFVSHLKISDLNLTVGRKEDVIWGTGPWRNWQFQLTSSNCVCWHSASKGNRLEPYEMGQRRNSLEATQVCNSFLAQVRGSQAQWLLCHQVAVNWFVATWAAWDRSWNYGLTVARWCMATMSPRWDWFPFHTSMVGSP